MIIIEKRLKIQETKKWKKGRRTERHREEEKKRIRKGFSENQTVEIIPAKYKGSAAAHRHLRVAAYCRVSTYEDAQAGSFELQIQHFKEQITKNQDWQFVNVYSDEGVSGTSIRKRFGFQHMIADCEAGKIDLILTKSISRFTRNTLDCLDVVRKLKGLNPPVGVCFETENLNTIETNSELILGVISLVAQGESEQKSAAITWSFIERCKKGIAVFSTYNLLGYDKDRFGKIIIADDEAEVVRYIYSLYLDGLSVREVAQQLTEQQIPTIRGNVVWSGSTVRNILRNEKYCGDVLMQKTFTVDCFSHKVMKNRGQKPQYLFRNHHTPIIQRDDWDKVQNMLKHPRYISKKQVSPIQKRFHISRVKTGVLKGFVMIDPKWNQKDIDIFFEIMTKQKG